MESLSEDEHPLEYTYSLSYFKRPPGKFNPEHYAQHVQPIASFNTVKIKFRKIFPNISILTVFFYE